MTDSKRSKNPSGGDRERRRAMQPSLHEVLMEPIVDRAKVFTAWKRVKANKGTPGVDGMTIDDFLDDARTKVRNLLALGTYKRQAIMTAISSKSYWHLSKTLATQSGMTNKWLKSRGLICVRGLWMCAHGYQ